MERESIMYVCEAGQPADSIRGLLRALKEPLAYTEFTYAGQDIVCVPIPVWKGFPSDSLLSKERSGRLGTLLAGWLNRYYIRKLQGGLWDILLACQNTSMQPAFCSEAVFLRFCSEKRLERELWLTCALPPEIVGAALKHFMKKDCVFRRQTRFFVVCSAAVPVTELLAPYSGSLNDLELLTQDKSPYEQFAEDAFEQFGLAVNLTARSDSARRADVIIDLSPEQALEADDIGTGCLYFDGFSHAKLEKALRGRRDVLYFQAASYWKAELRRQRSKPKEN